MFYEPRFRISKSIIASRSFSETVRDLPTLEEAISHHIARTCRRLREKHSKAQGLCILLTSQYTDSITHGFVEPTSDTRLIIQAAKNRVKELYHPQYIYKKFGIMLMDITQDTHKKYDLLLEKKRSIRR